ncbi:MAG: hypothetical protein QXI60_08205, partial [Thermofilaceae archaeon]
RGPSFTAAEKFILKDEFFSSDLRNYRSSTANLKSRRPDPTVSGVGLSPGPLRDHRAPELYPSGLKPARMYTFPEEPGSA